MTIPSVSNERMETELEYRGAKYKVSWQDIGFAQAAQITSKCLTVDQRTKKQDMDAMKYMRERLLASKIQIDGETFTNEHFMRIPSDFGDLLVRLLKLNETAVEEELKKSDGLPDGEN